MKFSNLALVAIAFHVSLGSAASGQHVQQVKYLFNSGIFKGPPQYVPTGYARGGCGCQDHCDSGPSCGCKPRCGCEPRCGCDVKKCGYKDKKCGCKPPPNCGCKPKCGCEPKCGCDVPRKPSAPCKRNCRTGTCGCEPRGCDSKPCGSSCGVRKICIPNIVPGLIKTVDRGCDRLFGAMVSCAPQKICFTISHKPIGPIFGGCKSGGCDCGATLCDCAGYNSGGDDGLPEMEGNPFRDDPEQPPLPPAAFRGKTPNSLPHTYRHRPVTLRDIR